MFHFIIHHHESLLSLIYVFNDKVCFFFSISINRLFFYLYKYQQYLYPPLRIRILGKKKEVDENSYGFTKIV
jgi:hypothetical protein